MSRPFDHSFVPPQFSRIQLPPSAPTESATTSSMFLDADASPTDNTMMHKNTNTNTSSHFHDRDRVKNSRRSCLCGQSLADEDELYCSVTCARNDALSSLCFNEQKRTSGNSLSASTSCTSTSTLTASSSHSLLFGGGGFNTCSLSSNTLVSSGSGGLPGVSPQPSPFEICDAYPYPSTSTATYSGAAVGITSGFPLERPEHIERPINSHAAYSAEPGFGSHSTSAAVAFEDWSEDSASHYRRMTREEMRRDERIAERRRRRDRRGSVVLPGPFQEINERQYGLSTRQQPSMHSSDVAASAGAGAGGSIHPEEVPELVGGGHHRNSSSETFSTISTSMTSCSLESRINSFASLNLSRNPSVSSNRSSVSSLSRSNHGHAGILKPAFPGIEEREEDDGDADGDAVMDCRDRSRASHQQQLPPQLGTAIGRQMSSSTKNRFINPLGMDMGQDMKDILDEIIQMEHDFVLSSGSSDVEGDRDRERESHRHHTKNSKSHPRQRRKNPGVLPRTPPLGVAAARRLSVVPPPAPLRSSHRLQDENPFGTSSFLLTDTCRRPSNEQVEATATNTSTAARGPSQTRFSRHIPSKSLSEIENDIACSPVSVARLPPRRSASPVRRSLTFTPLAASCHPGRFDTPPYLIQRPNNPVPPSPSDILESGPHTLSTFQFPLGLGTPTTHRTGPLLHIRLNHDPLRPDSISDIRTPTQASIPHINSGKMATPSLGPALFPASPLLPPQQLVAPHSGLRLGMLLGSGEIV